MLKVKNRYMIRPTIKSLWIYKGYGRRRIDNEFQEATLISIFKNHFLFNIDGDKWKIPHNAVEVYDIVNKPMNAESLKKTAIKVLERFSKHGFKKLSDDDLRIILALKHFEHPNYTKRESSIREEYPFEIACNMEKFFRDRGNIIRCLRSTFQFRDTKDNRNECLEDYK
jgi:hypothetical protein